MLLRNKMRWMCNVDWWDISHYFGEYKSRNLTDLGLEGKPDT